MRDDLSVDYSQVDRMERDLIKYAERAYPFATKNTLNQAAFHSQKLAKETVRNKMTVRNKWTEQSIRVTKAGTLNVNRQESVVGSVEEYMSKQESGGIVRKKGTTGVPIASSYSAGQGRGAKRTRLPRRPNKLSSISLGRSRGFGLTPKQRNLLAVKNAVKSGKRNIYLKLGRTEGIFRVVGGTKRNSSKAKVNMLWDMSRDSVVINSNPWLQPSVDQVSKKIPSIHVKSLEFQLKRNKLFHYS